MVGWIKNEILIFKIMKNDFCLLKKGTEIVLDNGIKTTIASNELLKEDFSYMWSKDDERVISTITDEYGDHYAVLDLEKLTPEDIDWSNDSIFVPKEDCKVNRYQDVYLSDVELPREIGELDREILKEMRDSVCIGSIYTSDFNNEFFVDRNVVMATTEDFYEEQKQKYGDKVDEHLSGEEFADFVLNM